MLSAQDCLQDLNRLAQENSSDKRREMLRRVTDLFFATEDEQKKDDSDVFGMAMDRLAYALEADARAELSDRLSESSKAPHDLVVRLANDDIEVARPILEKSTCLTDDDLVDIAGKSSQDHLMAMSSRKVLSPVVTDVIVERGDDTVLEKVTLNEGASFSDQGFNVLSDRSVKNEAVRKALTERADIPKEVLHQVKQKVAYTLAAEMAKTNPDLTASDIEAAVDAAAHDVSHLKQTAKDLREKFAQQHRTSPFTEDDIISFARAKRTEETIEVLALMSSLQQRVIRHCLLEAELAALGILCKASQFNEKTFAALLQLRLQLTGMPSNVAITEMKRYQNLDESTAQRVLRFLKVRLLAEKDEA